MSAPSIENQVAFALEILRWDKDKIEAYKSEHKVRSEKKVPRPGGDPTKGLPVILSRRTRDCGLETAMPFFDCARALSRKKLLAELLTKDIILATLDAEYQDHMPSTLDTLLAAAHRQSAHGLPAAVLDAVALACDARAAPARENLSRRWTCSPPTLRVR